MVVVLPWIVTTRVWLALGVAGDGSGALVRLGASSNTWHAFHLPELRPRHGHARPKLSRGGRGVPLPRYCFKELAATVPVFLVAGNHSFFG